MACRGSRKFISHLIMKTHNTEEWAAHMHMVLDVVWVWLHRERKKAIKLLSFIFWRSRDVVSRSELSEAGKIRKVRCDSALGLSKKTFFSYFVDFVSRCRHTHDPTRHGDWLEYHMRSSILIVSSLFLHKYACHNPHHTRIYFDYK